MSAPGGRLLVTVPAYAWLWSPHDESMHHRRRYSMRHLREQVTSAGWSPEAESYFFATMLPAVAAVRAVRRFSDNSNGSSDLALTPPRIGRLLELPSRGESRLIERGVRLPAGVSVGMVAAAV